MRSFFLGKGVPVHIKEMQVSQSLKNVTGGLGGNGEVAAEPAVHNPFGHSSARHFSTLQHEQRSQLTKRKHPLTMHSGIQSHLRIVCVVLGVALGVARGGTFREWAALRPVYIKFAIRIFCFRGCPSSVLWGGPWLDIAPPSHRRVILAPREAN